MIPNQIQNNIKYLFNLITKPLFQIETNEIVNRFRLSVLNLEINLYGKLNRKEINNC